MRSFYSASCVSGGHIWVSPSHLWVTVTSHVFKISMNWPARCLHLFFQLWNLNSCSAVAFSAPPPAPAPPTYPARPRGVSQAVIWTRLSCVYFNGMCSTLQLGFAKLLGILTSGRPWPFQRQHPKLTLPRVPVRTPGPLSLRRSQEAQAHWLDSRQGLV